MLRVNRFLLLPLILVLAVSLCGQFPGQVPNTGPIAPVVTVPVKAIPVSYIVPIKPTTDKPVTVGFLGAYNDTVARRNEAFGLWVDVLAQTLSKDGIKVEVEYRPGGTNPYFTLPDDCWLKVDGYWVYLSISHMTRVEADGTPVDPVAIVKGSLKIQKAFGKVQRE